MVGATSGGIDFDVYVRDDSAVSRVLLRSQRALRAADGGQG